ncbi:unnamed protein product [Closterium sp. Yama58-4]|nr:unnamed protein product [Closterium sp. Yama58-4]
MAGVHRSDFSLRSDFAANHFSFPSLSRRTAYSTAADQRAVVADVARLLSKPRSYDFREHHHHEQHSNEAHHNEDAERAAAASVKEGTTIGEVAAIELVRQLSPQGREVLLTALFPGADSAEAEEEFEHADAHHDGVISEGEFEQYVGEQQAKIDALHRPLDFPQLLMLAKKEALGNLGFGLTKNTVMIISGDFIASTLGAAFGFSTLMAAGLGNAVADVIGTWSRGAIESSSSKLLPGSTFSSHQLEHPKAQLFATVGAVIGVTVGGLLGLSPLFFLPTRGGGGEGGHGAGPAVTAGVAAASAAASAMKVAAPLATIASADGVEEAASGHATAAVGSTNGGMRGAFTRGATAHASISAAHWMGPSPSFRPPLAGAVEERGGLGVALLLALAALNVVRRRAMASLEVLAYTFGVLAVVLFGAGACAFAVYREVKQGGPDTPDFFLTARKSVPMLTIAWSFYAGAMGSWALFGPPSYCSYAGTLGMIMYSISAGLPIIIVAWFGAVIHRLVPSVVSMADYVRRRFGLVISLYVSALMLFNMGVAITAEYTAIGSLFTDIIGSKSLPIILVIGIVSLIYTAIGGLYVSIITDQWQAGVSVVFVLILFIFVCATFDAKLGPLPSEPVDLTWSNEFGLASIAVMPISLISSTLFSEAMWQRCWASASRKALLGGAALASVAVTIVVFLFGFGGLLAVWGGVWQPNEDFTNTNTILFSLFNNTTWVLVITTVLAVVMSESAVDSLQNAIADTLTTAFLAIIDFSLPLAFGDVQGAVAKTAFMAVFESKGIWAVRAIVLLFNVPPLVVALKGYNVLQLFLLANLLTTTSTIPVMAGVIPGKWSRRVVTPFSVGFGCLSGIASLFIWTQIYSVKYDMSYSDSLYQVFLNAYDYPPFLMALGFSFFGMLVGAGMEAVVRMALKLEYPEFDLGSEELPVVEGGEMVDAGMEKLGMGDGAGAPMVSNS